LFHHRFSTWTIVPFSRFLFSPFTISFSPFLLIFPLLLSLFQFVFSFTFPLYF
jgi:hypothetical protein